MAEEKEGMQQEEVEERVKGEAEVNPDVASAQTFADDVAGKVALIESGEMTLEEFVAGCTEALKAVTEPAGELGGLGDNSGEFPELDDEEEV